jgi:hypothetical protein
VERSFDILLSRRAEVEAGLTALAKRFARKGFAPIVFSFGRAFTSVDVVRSVEFPDLLVEGKVARIPLTIEGEAPHFAGWSFAAALEHVDGSTIVRTVDGSSVDAYYRTRGPVCDHCKAQRNRSETYILRHADGSTIQIGSTCIDDFLGSDDALSLIARASMLASAFGMGDGACYGEESGSGSGERTLSAYLPIVAWSVAAQGWVSRTKGQEQGVTPTADMTWRYMSDRSLAAKAGVAITSEHEALAAAAEAWAVELSGCELSDYEHNLGVIARSGLVSSRSAGLAASIVVAYQNYMAKLARISATLPSHFVGTVGKRETFAVRLDFVTGYATQYGYTTVLRFVMADGAILVWKASSTDISRGDVGRSYALAGSVKSHETYNGVPQTMITRCKVAAVAP